MSTTRREYLLRKQKGKSILPSWKAAIEDACQQNIDIERFLDIEETERLRSKFFGKVRDGGYEHHFVAKPDFCELVSTLRTLATNNETDIVLFHSMDKFVGALEMSNRVVFERLEAIWTIVEEDLCIATRDLASGFCLEKNYYDEFGNYVSDGVFELTVWGEFTIKWR